MSTVTTAVVQNLDGRVKARPHLRGGIAKTQYQVLTRVRGQP